MGDKITAPRDIHALTPEPAMSVLTWEQVTLPGNRDFAGGIKLRILSWEDYSGLSGPSVITRILIRGRREGQSHKRQGEDRWRMGPQAKECRQMAPGI